ncbi:MAG: ZIP family metal transporter [Candidatus Portnoybacteria bacterium]|nr:ZIP family metal transporter [Candidatus Portnoybacteria bacterium]
MQTIIIVFALLTFCSTLCGGLFALKFRHQLNSFMAFAAGVILGVVAFGIFPEIIEQVKAFNFNPVEVMAALVVGFLLFHILEKTILIHHAHEEDYAEHKHPKVGVISALALVGHSFMDGLSIGLGFQINTVVGLMIAVAVISHGFTDGINTITLMLNHKNTPSRAKFFLVFDALAPSLGIVTAFFFTFSPHFLILYLGFFAGFLLYIGASDILPEAHSQRSSYKLIGLTIFGTLFIFIITRFV